jgi:membrane protein
VRPASGLAEIFESKSLSELASRRTAVKFFTTWREAFARNEILTYATAIAYRLLIALVPLLLLGLLILGYLRSDYWSSEIRPVVEEKFSAANAFAIDSTADRIMESRGASILALSLLLLIWETSSAVRASMSGLNRIFGVQEGRSFWHRFGLSFLLGGAVGACVLVSIFAVGIAPRAFEGTLDTVVGISRWPFAVAVLTLAVGLLLRFAPAERVGVGWASLGSLLVVGAWLLASVGFGFYVSAVASFKSGVQTLTALLVLTGYLYTSAVIFLVGTQADAFVRDKASERS